MKSSALRFILQNAPLLLFTTIVAALGFLAPRFLTIANGINVVIQSAPVAVVAVGMTFVLLTAGVDLSVGAIMFVGGAVAAKLLLAGQSVSLACIVMVVCGIAFGAVNALFITRGGLVPFIVTLATLFIGRGFALWLTQTRAINLPDWFLRFGSVRFAGVPLPVATFALVVALAHLVLSRTPFGRQIYAVGNHPENARKAGVPVRRLIFAVYLISGLCSAAGGIFALTQLGAISPKFGENYEFKAIAAAVLGGTSLFGGRGGVWPGTVLGALLIQMLESGLVMLNVDPYVYPLVTAAVILLAVFLDSMRERFVSTIRCRPLRDARGSH